MLKALICKGFSFFISHTDVLFIYCPIVTAVSARYCCRYAQASAAAIYFHATKPETVVIIRSEQAIAEIRPIASSNKL
ncbi:MAG: hypothetical protein F6K54_40750 [Okeania sp. SIO3B5]|uniref:hypothetical protein n=1 Tax=Okeania sp. SIO3B5 TaxID=2607811 RepID=UPI0013FF4D41|nr:hypothetical protein [Okeania sp. SIO3B5]NEO58813.1 hypothetical protein [Okeania sp. SIO3B5]